MASVPGVEPPFTICEVEVSEQSDIVLIGHLEGIAPDQLIPGLEMKVGFAASSNGPSYPQIEPV